MSTNTSITSAMHNDIMEAGSKDSPPMLAPVVMRNDNPVYMSKQWFVVQLVACECAYVASLRNELHKSHIASNPTLCNPVDSSILDLQHVVQTLVSKSSIGIKRLHDDLRVNIVKVKVTTVSINAAGIKVNAAAYNC
ncbi:hypothetical protein Tco_1372599 [Tanacetum coccineum]